MNFEQSALDFVLLKEKTAPRYRDDVATFIADRKELIEEFSAKIDAAPTNALIAYLVALVKDTSSVEQFAPRAARQFLYIATKWLKEIEGGGGSVDDLMTFEEYCIKDSVPTKGTIYFRMFDVDKEDFFEALYEELMRSVLDNFRNSIAQVCNMVYLGLPIYSLGEDGALTEVDRKSELVSFIRGLGKYFYTTDDWRNIPEWAVGLYVKNSDIDRHNLFFSHSSPLTREQEETLTQAYRDSLGQGKAPARPAQTDWNSKLSQCATSMVRHFESKGHSRALGGQWPLQKEVVFWLVEGFSLSNREAEAIDMITRPDHLRAR